MARSLSEIKNDIVNRMLSQEYLPDYISRENDLDILAEGVGNFIAPYILGYEKLLDVYNDLETLSFFLRKRGMYLSGSENLSQLQSIANNRLLILSFRGTSKMSTEVQRLVNENVLTNIQFSGVGNSGWICGRTSPCYRESSSSSNVSYLGLRKLVIFNLKNETDLDNSYVEEIIKKYFMPVHVRSFVNFL